MVSKVAKRRNVSYARAVSQVIKMVQLKPKRDRKPKRRFIENQSSMTSSPSGKMQFNNGILLELASCLGEPNRIRLSDDIAFQPLCPRRSLRPRIGGCCSFFQVHGLQPLCDVTEEETLETEGDKEKQRKISQLFYRLKRRACYYLETLNEELWLAVVFCIE